MINKKTIGLIATCLFLAFSGFAQSNTSEKWNLQQCIDYALENNLTVRRGELSVQQNKVAVTQAKASLLPSASISSSYYKNYGLSPSADNTLRNVNTNSIGLSGSSSITVFNGFQLINSIRQSNTNLEGARQDLEKAKNDIRLQVVNAFLNIIFNKEMVKNANFQLQSTAKQLEQIEKLYQAGAKAESDLMEIQAQFANNEYQLVNAKNSTTMALLELKQSLQIPASADFDIEVPEILLTPYSLEGSNPENIYMLAEKIQPQIKSADLGVESAKLGKKIAFGAYLPRLSFGANISTNYYEAEGVDIPFRTQFKNNQGKSIGLNLSVPLLNGLSTRSSVQRATLNTQIAKITATEQRNTLRQTIERAYTDALAASSSYQAALKRTESLEEVFRVMEEKYSLGAVNSVDYQVASNNLFAAQTDLVKSKFEYIFKLKLLDFYQGKDITLE
ncbi:TolC family protein [Xanthovirga aplysinae]|uniref:TolC family protein n=1 Tax=Xanthovirga aplysinae TaxID=2529853 RepID=UPI0012BD0956|nr:TolC family protein [Xanthovirga aplysinae]MTI30152.1 TolC family protein [Xanthovirga aplysinae]